MSAGQAGYYIELSRREDYYLEGGEPPGRWFGTGAEKLGLSGDVLPDHLYNLFDGLTPTGDRSLIQRQRHAEKADHRPGWDCTFSSPKTVSTLWSQVDEPTRSVIQDVHHRAVEAALSYLQETAAATRRGKGGTRLERTGIIAAVFEHSTSRALDPQLHSHALLMNLSLRSDGTTGTLSSLDIFLSKMAAGALYRAELAKGLQVRLGLSLVREKAWFEVEGVSKELVKVFSKRRTDIEESLQRSGLRSAEAAAVAATQTRTAKEAVSRQALFSEWESEGERVGWGREKAERLIHLATPPRDLEREGRDACGRATERLTQDEAHFTERDFVRYLAEEAQTRGLGADEVRAAAQEHLRSATEIVRLGEYRGQERFSTRTMVEMEDRLLKGAQTLASDARHKLPVQTVMEVFVRSGTMNEEQLRAAWHLTVESGSIAVVSGMAGTGKTTMLRPVKEAFEAEGYRVIGATISARAAKELEFGAAIPSDTIARILLDLDRKKGWHLDDKTVLVVDEAGMVATPEMLQLVNAVLACGAKLILVGDARQLQPIGPGAPFLELGERHGRAELKEVRRQNDDWARKAVKDLASGDAKAALKEFADRGLLTFAKTRALSVKELVTVWRQDGLPPEETLLLASTVVDAQSLNQAAQTSRHEAGELGHPFTEIDGQKMHLNDRVMFTKNKRTLGVQNGAKGTICDVSGDRERISVHLDTGSRISINVLEHPYLQLGYASTVHKAQGTTATRAYVLGGGPMESRELANVEASRAREQTRIVSTGQAEFQNEDFERLVREMARSRQKSMAHTVTREKEKERPPER